MQRRMFVESLAAYASTAAIGGNALTVRGQAPAEWRDAFPALNQVINGHPLVYLDTAATALRPQPVIDALVRFYSTDNANPGGALHTLARRANTALENARATTARHIGARDPLEVVFTRGTTEGLNLVASTWGSANVHAGDEILIGIAEHSSNMLPWRALARRSGARLVYFGMGEDGHPRLDDMARRINTRTRIVAFSHVSNVLGMINPVREMCALAKGPNRIVVVDGAQSVPHLPVDVGTLGCDFLAFSSHKMAGPMAVGVLWGRRELLDSMPPYQSGSNMAHDVDLESEHHSAGALKYSAGTPNVSGPVGLAAAIDFLNGIGSAAIRAHELAINTRMLARLAAVHRVRLLGAPDADKRVSVFSFVVEGHAPADLVRAFDADGIAIRGGDLAALPLLQQLGVKTAARASCYLYTTTDDVDRFADVLARIAGRG